MGSSTSSPENADFGGLLCCVDLTTNESGDVEILHPNDFDRKSSLNPKFANDVFEDLRAILGSRFSPPTLEQGVSVLRIRDIKLTSHLWSQQGGPVSELAAGNHFSGTRGDWQAAGSWVLPATTMEPAISVCLWYRMGFWKSADESSPGGWVVDEAVSHTPLSSGAADQETSIKPTGPPISLGASDLTNSSDPYNDDASCELDRLRDSLVKSEKRELEATAQVAILKSLLNGYKEQWAAERDKATVSSANVRRLEDAIATAAARELEAKLALQQLQNDLDDVSAKYDVERSTSDALATAAAQAIASVATHAPPVELTDSTANGGDARLQHLQRLLEDADSRAGSLEQRAAAAEVQSQLLRGSLTEAERTIAQIKAQLEASIKEGVDAAAQLADAKAAVAASAHDCVTVAPDILKVQELEASLSAFEAENARLTTAIAEVSSDLKDSQYEAGQQRGAALEAAQRNAAEIDRLNSELSRVKAISAVDRSAATAAQTNAEAQIAQLQAQLDAAAKVKADAETRALQAYKEKSEIETASLAAAVDTAAHVTRINGRLEELGTVLSKSEAENAALRSALDAAESKSNALAGELRTAEAQLKASHEVGAAARYDVEQLQISLTSAQSTIADLEARESKRLAAAGSLAEHDAAEINRLKAELASDRSASATVLKHAEDNIVQLQARLDASIKAAAEAEAEASRARNESAEIETGARAAAADSAAALARVTYRAEELETSVSTSDAEIARLQRALQAEVNKSAILADTVAAAEDVAALTEEKLAEADAHARELRSSLDRATAEIARLQKALADALAARDSALSALEAANARRSAAEEKLLEATRTSEDLIRALREAGADIARLEASMSPGSPPKSPDAVAPTGIAPEDRAAVLLEWSDRARTVVYERLHVYVHPLIRGGFNSASLATVASSSSLKGNAAKSLALASAAHPHTKSKAVLVDSGVMLDFREDATLSSPRGSTHQASPTSTSPAQAPAQPHLGIGLIAAPGGAVIVAHLSDEYHVRTTHALAHGQTDRIIHEQHGGLITRSSHQGHHHGASASAAAASLHHAASNASALLAVRAAVPDLITPLKPGGESDYCESPLHPHPAASVSGDSSSSSSSGSEGGSPPTTARPEGSPPSSARSEPPAHINSADHWLQMLWALPPVPATVARQKGHALGLAAAQSSLVVSQRISEQRSSVSAGARSGSGSSPPSASASAAAASSDEFIMRVGDVLIALNGVPTTGMTAESAGQKLLRLTQLNGTWVTIARPVGKLSNAGAAASAPAHAKAPGGAKVAWR